MLTLVTPTRNRPEAFDLLQRWVGAQTYAGPYQWVVVNDGDVPYDYRLGQDVVRRTPAEGEGPSQHQNLLHAIPLIRGDKVLIIEDDDYYHPDYLKVMAGMLDHYALVGEGRAVYYNVRTRRYVLWDNLRHASLAQTGLRAEAIPTLVRGCREGSRYIDLHLWDNFPGVKHVFTGDRLHVGIKGMPGEAGFGICHGDEGTDDVGLETFRGLNIPAVYESFYRPDVGADDAPENRGVRWDLIAPVGTGDVPDRAGGRCERKPWDYRVTAVIPHLNTPGPLRWSVETLRQQSEKPYILVIDTGSDRAACESVEALRDEGLEVHYLKGHAWAHTAEPVAAAMDTAFARCQTELMYCTHADCFVRRRDWLEWLASRCGEAEPVIGYQMSDRSDLTREWEWMVSHTATMLHMPTMRRAGASWSFQRYWALRSVYRADNPDWIDTETGFNWSLRRAGIAPSLLGPEVNFDRQTDDNIDHVRSYPSASLYTVGTDSYRTRKDQWMEDAVREARERVRAWKHAPGRAVRSPRPPASPQAGG